MCWVEFDAAVDCVHVMLYACGGGKCGIINNTYIIHVSGIENQVFGINKVFNASFFSSCCRNISATVPEIGEPMATPLSGWYIWFWKVK